MLHVLLKTGFHLRKWVISTADHEGCMFLKQDVEELVYTMYYSFKVNAETKMWFCL